MGPIALGPRPGLRQGLKGVVVLSEMAEELPISKDEVAPAGLRDLAELKSKSGVLPIEQISNIGFIRTAFDGLAHELIIGRKFACRVGISRIASKECSLATAAAKVDLSLWTRPTWVRHPFGAAKPIETFGCFPDPG